MTARTSELVGHKIDTMQTEREITDRSLGDRLADRQMQWGEGA
jgi:hypothetical protein